MNLNGKILLMMNQTLLALVSNKYAEDTTVYGLTVRDGANTVRYSIGYLFVAAHRLGLDDVCAALSRLQSVGAKYSNEDFDVLNHAFGRIRQQEGR